MKKLLYLIIILACYIPSQAQKLQFTDTTNNWYFLLKQKHSSTSPITYFLYEYYYDNNSQFINGHTYNTLHQSLLNNRPTTGAAGINIRYDSIKKQVLFIGTNNNEFVLYDYSLKVGDTFKAALPSSSKSGGYINVSHEVDMIDSIKVNNVYHKRFFLRLIDPSLYSDAGAADYSFVEGLGCPIDILFPMRGSIDITLLQSLQGIRIFCFYNKGIVPISDSVQYSCGDTALNASHISNSYKQLYVYPQPASSSTTIELPQNIRKGACMVYNNLGQIVYTYKFDNKQKLVIPHLPGGIYFYKIWSDTTEYNGKLLFE